MRKITCLLMATILLFSFSACKNDQSEVDSNSVNSIDTNETDLTSKVDETNKTDTSSTKELSSKDGVSSQTAKPNQTNESSKIDKPVQSKKLSNYVIACYDSISKDVANELCRKIKEKTGVELMVKHEADIYNEPFIYILLDGTLFYDDFMVYEDGDDIYICGGSRYALNTAVERFVKKMSSSNSVINPKSLTFSYVLPDRSVYINDFSKLALHWESSFKTPSWMLDFGEKYAAMLDVDGRLISCLHRGDMVYYPENSIEGIISAVQMGADMIEIDPRLTKDGVFILMHDDTLNRTTDFLLKSGKNGLPSSPYVSDWTYDELMQLCLKDWNGTLTPYKIPTLDEAIKVCANRIFVRLDVKGPEDSELPFWNFEKDIWPLMQKYNCPTTVIYTWHKFFRANDFELVKKYRQLSKKACGKEMLGFLNNKSTVNDALNVLDKHKLNYAMRLTFNLSEYGYDTFLKENKARLSGFKGKIRIYADVHNTNVAYPQNKESYELYETLYDAGINVQLVNEGFLLCNYIAKNFKPTTH